MWERCRPCPDAALPAGAFPGKQPRIVRSPALRARDGLRRLPYRRAKRRSEIIEILTIHHVSVPVSDLERSKAFYGDVLGLNEIRRPPADTPGAWYQIGDRELHLIAGNHATFREGKAVDDRDIHFALRVASYRVTRRFLLSKGFHPETDDELKRMKESPGGAVGRPRIHIMDPDRNVIELIAEQLNGD